MGTLVAAVRMTLRPTPMDPMLTCPFCGVVTESPHETQQGCIDALQAEIARVRAVLKHVHSAEVPLPQEDADDTDPPVEN